LLLILLIFLVSRRGEGSAATATTLNCRNSVSYAQGPDGVKWDTHKNLTILFGIYNAA
jgi:hypothetical protein